MQSAVGDGRGLGADCRRVAEVRLPAARIGGGLTYGSMAIGLRHDERMSRSPITTIGEFAFVN